VVENTEPKKGSHPGKRKSPLEQRVRREHLHISKKRNNGMPETGKNIFVHRIKGIGKRSGRRGGQATARERPAGTPLKGLRRGEEAKE